MECAVKINVRPGVFVVAATCLLLRSGPASAQEHKRVYRIARLIETHAKELHDELDDQFKPSPAYKHLHQVSREIEKLARTVNEIPVEIPDEVLRKMLREAVQRLEGEIRNFAETAEDAPRFRQVLPQAYTHLRLEARYLHEAVRDMKRELD
jgi:predicted phage-related endonuclease